MADYAFSPRYMRVRAGQTVVFRGDFDRHPLETSCGSSPALDKRSGTGEASFVLARTGLHGYFCVDHGNPAGEVMAGAIDVVP